METDKCTRCGKSIESDTATRCPHCGLALGDATELKGCLYVLLAVAVVGIGCYLTYNWVTDGGARHKLPPIKENTQLNEDDKPVGNASTYKKWALESGYVTDISINNPYGEIASLFVILPSNKYTTEENVESIAVHLARAYCQQTGVKAASVHVYLGEREYAVGRYIK